MELQNVPLANKFDQSLIERSKYKSFCCIVKECYFTKKTESLKLIVHTLYNLHLDKDKCWGYFKTNIDQSCWFATPEKGVLERNQFAIMYQIAQIYSKNAVLSEIEKLKNIYIRSQSKKTKKFKDD